MRVRPVTSDSVDLGLRRSTGRCAPLVDEHGQRLSSLEGRISGFDANGRRARRLAVRAARLGCIERGNECGARVTPAVKPWLEPPLMAPREASSTRSRPAAGAETGRAHHGRQPLTALSGPAGRRPFSGEGATWDSVTIGENRRAYAVAVEPEPGDKFSTSILAFAPNGTREWITTLVEP